MTASEGKQLESPRKALLPGDPFPWSPASPVQAVPDEESEKDHGVTHSPARADDLASFDLGGGD